MNITIALAGNPNSGKTTLFNALTGSNQYVGNWPGVTVEKKEGKLKKHSEVTITDLPGIYSLSPYTLEEVVARNYLLEEHPDVILNIVDGSNLERNLYLTTQLLELGIPVVAAINMMDIVRKNGDAIDLQKLSFALGIPVVEICALKEEGIETAAAKAMETAAQKKAAVVHAYDGQIESALGQIEQDFLSDISPDQKRWYAVKIFERDEKVLDSLKLTPAQTEKLEQVIEAVETAMDDDSESIITNERYMQISSLLKNSYTKKNQEVLSVSDKIDRIVTNRVLGLPIFACVMFLVYWISMVGVGSLLTDWANDGLFGDGWHLMGIGSEEWNADLEEYTAAANIADGYEIYLEENGKAPETSFTYQVEDEETLALIEEEATLADYENALVTLEAYGEEPDPAEYGIWIEGVPVFVENLLNTLNVSETGAGAVIRGVILDGIVAGVGAVLGFVPQMLVLFLLLAFLESCGYMARIAFVLDRVFRKFGLSGKSFIPMLVGVGCGVPGVMASRTIENERDRRMTIMTTTFIPCGAKIPFIAMIAGAIFNGAAWVSVSAYFIGMAAIIISGLILKKTRPFAGEPAPFVMEMPVYHMPTIKSLLHSAGERGWSFIKKAGTIILLSTVIIWFMTYFGFTDQGFGMLSDEELHLSILAYLGQGIAWMFAPLGWGNWQAAVASVTGLVAKENIVGTMGVLYGGEHLAAGMSVYQNMALSFTMVSGFSFLVFNLLCAPCFAAIGAIRREMNNMKWTWAAIGWQCGFAYAIAFMINQFGNLYFGQIYGIFGWMQCVLAFILLGVMIWLVVRPYPDLEKERKMVQNKKDSMKGATA